jgi:DNA-binding transcriptional LysR family regulator
MARKVKIDGLQPVTGMNEELSWDEFRLVKAISDSGSLGGAAQILGLNHSTVFRRLAALEMTVGARLFERSREGYRATAAGQEMIALATTMADSIVEFERKLAGRDVRPTGRLRVTTVEAFAQQILPAIMAQFKAQYPGVVIELTLSSQILNLSRRDADVAIRVTNDPPETLVGRRLCAVRWAIYYRRDLVAALGSQPLESAPFIGFGENFGPPAGRRWIETHVRPGRVVGKVNSILNMRELAAQGLGAALLPCVLGDVSPALIRLAPPLAELEAGLWILTHSDLRRSARVRAFMDFASAEIAKQRRLLEGADGEDAAAPGLTAAEATAKT